MSESENNKSFAPCKNGIFTPVLKIGNATMSDNDADDVLLFARALQPLPPPLAQADIGDLLLLDAFDQIEALTERNALLEAQCEAKRRAHRALQDQYDNLLRLHEQFTARYKQMFAENIVLREQVATSRLCVTGHPQWHPGNAMLTPPHAPNVSTESSPHVSVNKRRRLSSTCIVGDSTDATAPIRYSSSGRRLFKKQLFK